jgi:hypothetical protein
LREGHEVITFWPMSKAELPKLTAVERTEIWDHLWRLEATAPPTETERLILDEAQADYDANPTAGAAWSEVEARLRSGA